MQLYLSIYWRWGILLQKIDGKLALVCVESVMSVYATGLMPPDIKKVDI